jgi:photosystem II stability/assembly factor-like uncharacterized protein
MNTGKKSLFILALLCMGLLGQAQDVFTALQPRSVGPAEMSGRITAIEVDPTDSAVIYVGSAGGGVWRSQDGGIVFSHFFKDQMSIGALAIDPQDPKTIWIGTGECNVRNSVGHGDGLYVTRDGGRSFERVGFAQSERIARVVVDPRDSKTIYAAVLGHLWDDHEERGLFKSSDAGKTWERLLYVDQKTGCIDVEIDPQDSQVLYSALWQVRRTPWSLHSGGPGSGLYRSTDGGESWHKIHKGLPDGDYGRINLAIAPSRPATVYALVEAEQTALYRSNAMGESWQKVNDTMAVKMRPFYFSKLWVDPVDPDRVYTPSLILFASRDAGRTFDFKGGSTHSDHHALWINPKNPKHLILGTDGGVYISYDQGSSFRHVGTLPVSQLYHVSTDNDTPYNLYCGLQDNGSWTAPSQSPGGIGNKLWRSVGYGDGFYVFRHPRDRDIIYFSWQGGKLRRYNQNSGESKNISPMPEDEKDPVFRMNWNAAVSMSHHNPDGIYAGAQFLFYSPDRGDSWQRLSPDLTSNDPLKQQQNKSGGLTLDNTSAENHCTLFTISESPLDEQILWVGSDDGRLHVTRDRGKTWTNVTGKIPGLPPSTWCSGVEASHFSKGKAYVTFDGHRTGDLTAYVYKTGDYGQTWTRLGEKTVSGNCHVIREDPIKENLLFLGSENGLFGSIDGGQTWEYFDKNLPRVPVFDLQIHPREHDLIIATHGLGIYILDDLTPVRAITPEVMSQDVIILPSRPSVQVISTQMQAFPGNGSFVGDNPPSGAVISYYLKARHIFGKLSLDIIAPDGSLIKSLPTSKRKGLNRVYWNMRYKNPKTPTAPGLSMGVSVGPMVKTGDYKVKLVKGDQTVEGSINLIADERGKHGSEEQGKRFDMLMGVYHLLEDFSYYSESAKSLITQIDGLTDEKQRKRLAAFRSQLENFRKNYVQYDGIMSGDKLRERLMAFYSDLMQYGGLPSPGQQRYISVLEQEVGDMQSRFTPLVGPALKAANSKLTAGGAKPLVLKSKEDYLKED